MILLFSLLSCTPAADPCDAFCVVAAEVEQSCLEAAGLDWSAAGYEDDLDYRASCGTWAWEQRLLARDAGVDEAQVGERCAAHQAALEEGGCEALSAIDWDDPAWEGSDQDSAEVAP